MPLLSFFQVQAATLVEKCDSQGQHCAADIPQLTTILQNFLGIAATLAGMLAVVTIIIGGFKYIIAHGDPKGVASAKSTITWAVAGLFFLVLAYLVLALIKQVTGVDVTRFSVPFFTIIPTPTPATCPPTC